MRHFSQNSDCVINDAWSFLSLLDHELLIFFAYPRRVYQRKSKVQSQTNL